LEGKRHAEEQYIAANLKEHLRDHALFTGFAPIENPKIAIAVIGYRFI
jgi:penicillin-binding protein 2